MFQCVFKVAASSCQPGDSCCCSAVAGCWQKAARPQVSWVSGHGECRLSSLSLLPTEIPAALRERMNNSLAPASLEEVFNGFYVLQMISLGTGAEELCRSVFLPGSLLEGASSGT